MTDATETGRLFADADGDTTFVRQDGDHVVVENMKRDETVRAWTPAKARAVARWMLTIADAIEPLPDQAMSAIRERHPAATHTTIGDVTRVQVPGVERSAFIAHVQLEHDFDAEVARALERLGGA